jgi:hypothetical protein
LKKSPSPSKNTSSNVINPIQIHDEDVKTSTASVDYNSVPIANSLDLSSDDDPFDKTAGASSSTTTSSLIFDSKNVAFSDDETLALRSVNSLLLNEQALRISSTSLNILADIELENSIAFDKSVRQPTVSIQRQRFIPTCVEVERSFFISQQGNHKAKTSTTAHKDISYSSVLQGLLNNANVRVKIADLGNACFDVRFIDSLFPPKECLKHSTSLFSALSLYGGYPDETISLVRSSTRYV